MAETKYNLLTRLLKNIKNVVTPDGNVAGSGGSGGMLVVHGTITYNADKSTDYTIDKTWQEIYDAGFAVLRIVNDNVPDGIQVVKNDGILFFAVGPHEGAYRVSFAPVFSGEFEWPLNLTTDNANGYPSAHEDPTV